MTTYIYDGSFNGMLCLIFEAALRQKRPQNIIARSKERQQKNLFEGVEVETRSKIAQAVYHVLEEHTNGETLITVFYALHAHLSHIDLSVFNYLELAWQKRKNINGLLSDERVLYILDARRKVSRERHMFCGVLRFRDVGGIYYATIEPEHYILPLLGGHFEKRFPHQNWIIHDVKRSKALIYDQREWYETEFSPRSIPQNTSDEQTYQELWKTFFHSVTITSRTNRGLQKRNMPLKYWKYLTEMEEKIPETSQEVPGQENLPNDEF
ncbi:MAG: TIGR03915 family putative DNA repair protein [Aminobacterium sp.]|nr:TIGR03915 family putative DNA repair protein [Aminobacterium sp.]